MARTLLGSFTMTSLTMLSLTITTACATSDKPDTPGGAMSAKIPNIQRATTEDVGFAASRDGTRLAFEKTGRGPALVIVSGALSERKGGKALAAELEDHFTVYRYDRRGRGGSGDTKPYAVDREIEDLGAMIEQAGNEAFVYGVSSGAALALQAAPKLGAAKVPKLAVYEAPYGQETRVFEEQKESVHQLVETGKPGDAAAFFLSAIGTPPPVLQKLKGSPEWEGMRKMDFTLVYDYAVLGNGQVPDTVTQISVPTLVMTGEKGMGFMHQTANRIAKLVPNAERKTIEGQTHQASPQVMARLLTEFFAPEK